VRWVSTALATSASSPYFGGRSLPVRVRPPSMYHSRLKRLAQSHEKYSRTIDL
jgi:hypothetical protein